MQKKINPNYLTPKKVSEISLKEKYDLDILKDELNHVYENSLRWDSKQEFDSSYMAISFGSNLQVLSKRFNLDWNYHDDDEEFPYDYLDQVANDELKKLQKTFPEIFNNNFYHSFGWEEGTFGILVGTDEEGRDNYLEEKMKKSNPNKYEPMFLSWCKSYDEEVEELRNLIDGNPADCALLKEEYEELTGKAYRKKREKTEKAEKTKKPKLTLLKNNPDYLKSKFNPELMKRLAKIFPHYEFYADSDYRTSLNKIEDVRDRFLDPEIFFTSDLFRYTDYGGAGLIAKVNIQYIEENFQPLIDEELISIYSTSYNGQNCEFKIEALKNDDLFEILDSLDGYPIIDDDMYSMAEHDEAEEYWNDSQRDEIKNDIEKEFDVELTDDEVDAIAYEMQSNGDMYIEHEGASAYYRWNDKDLAKAIKNIMSDKKKDSIKTENPNWVSDETLWEKAKKESMKNYGKLSYPFVVFLYKQMGGKVKKKNK